MKIDIERLGKDLDYWNSVAPEGAEARIDGGWTSWAGETELSFCGGAGTWRPSNNPWSLEKYLSAEVHEVTTRPAAADWNGEGLPPVGCECELYPYFIKCRVVCEYMGGIVLHDMHNDQLLHASKGEYRFRPIRTPEQIKRDELVAIISRHPIYKDAVTRLADAIIADGWAKP